MLRRAIVVFQSNAFRYGADLLTDAVASELDRHGFDVLKVPETATAITSRQDDLYFFIHWVVPDKWRKVRGRSFIINCHPVSPYGHYPGLPNRVFKSMKTSIGNGWAEAVFDYNKHTTEWLKKAGINAFFLPIGYHDCFSRFASSCGYDVNDVVFIGDPSGRRKAVLRDLKAKTVFGFYGKDRDSVLSCNSIFLNLNTVVGSKTFLSMRAIVLYGSNGRAFIQEECDWCPLIHGEHCLIGKERDLSELVERFKDIRYRDKIRKQCFLFLKNEYKFSDFFTSALERVEIL